MPIPTATSPSVTQAGPKLEDSFQPILPKVDHILSLIREHQEQLCKAETSSGGNDKRDQKGVVDLEDKIIKEVSQQSSLSQPIFETGKLIRPLRPCIFSLLGIGYAIVVECAEDGRT